MARSPAWRTDSDVQRRITRFLEATRAASKERRLAPVVKQTEKRVAAVFRKQGRLMVKEMAQHKALFESLREAPPMADWLAALAAVERQTNQGLVDAVLPGAGVSMELAAGVIMKDLALASLGIDYSFNLDNPLAVAYLRQVGADLVTNVNSTTRDTLRRIAVQAAEEGWSYNRTAKAITDRFVEFAVGKPQLHIQSRAHLVAVTELGNAYEESNLIVAQDMASEGLEMEKKWLTTGDDRVSDGCRENEAQGWIPAGDDFKSGHQRPLRFPGCRCSSEFRVKR